MPQPGPDGGSLLGLGALDRESSPGRDDLVAELGRKFVEIGHDAVVDRCRTLIGRHLIELRSRQQLPFVVHAPKVATLSTVTVEGRHEPPTGRSRASAEIRISETCPPETGLRHTDNHRDGARGISWLAGSAVGSNSGIEWTRFVNRMAKRCSGSWSASASGSADPAVGRNGLRSDLEGPSRGSERHRRPPSTAPVETRSVLGRTDRTWPRHEPDARWLSAVTSQRSAGEGTVRLGRRSRRRGELDPPEARSCNSACTRGGAR